MCAVCPLIDLMAAPASSSNPSWWEKGDQITPVDEVGGQGRIVFAERLFRCVQVKSMATKVIANETSCESVKANVIAIAMPESRTG
jgi:hypothetical protein